MTSIFNKFKSLAMLVVLLSFFMGATLSSCSGNKKEENTEKASESDEHPSAEKNSASDEHPSGGEHEHPSDSTSTEHPTK